MTLYAKIYLPRLRNFRYFSLPKIFFCRYLLTSQQRRSVIDLMPMIGARFYTQLDSIQSRTDILENEVAKEMENGRLFRLMVKLGTINERPEWVSTTNHSLFSFFLHSWRIIAFRLNMDGTWSETGDRYMLKLFRDYVFHQVTEDGRPWVDMAHVVQCLNKLDAGAPEKVLFNIKNMLLYTYIFFCSITLL